MGAEADGPLAGALERTIAAATARLTLTRHYDFTAPVPVLRRQGGIVNSAVRRALGGTLSVRVDRGAIVELPGGGGHGVLPPHHHDH